MGDPLVPSEQVEMATPRAHGHARLRLRLDPRFKRMVAQDRHAREAKARGAHTLERLRYQRYAKSNTLSNVMQRLGDWGRRHVAALYAIRLRY